MYLIKKLLLWQPVFLGQCIARKSPSWSVKIDGVSGPRSGDCGIVGPETDVRFSSQSAKVFLLIELSGEMLQTGINSTLTYLSDLFKQWDDEDTSHVVTIVCFSRCSAGEDCYRVLYNGQRKKSWLSQIGAVKEKISANFDEFGALNPVLSAEICLFEAIGLTLNVFDRYHYDRDLTLSGMSVIVLSSGTGKYHHRDINFVHVIEKTAMELGVWIQLVRLGDKSGHITPLLTSQDQEYALKWINHIGALNKWEIIDDGLHDLCSQCSSRFENKNDFLMVSDRLSGISTLVSIPCFPLDCKAVEAETVLTGYEEEEYKVVPDFSSKYFRIRADDSEGDLLKLAMNELLLLRLNQGYQLVKSSENQCIFSFGHSLQKLTILKNAIRVQIYREPIQKHELSYSYTMDSRKETTVLKGRSLVNWSILDNALAGNAPLGSSECLGCWKTRFVLIPGPNIVKNDDHLGNTNSEFSESDLRISAFKSFLALVTESMEGLKDDSVLSILSPLGITLSTLSLSSYVSDELRNRRTAIETTPVTPAASESSSEDLQPLTRSSSVEEMAALMQHALVGLSIKERKWYSKTYEDVFIGSEAVDWMLKFFDDVPTREVATEIGRDLVENGVWEHVNDEHPFIDGHFYYRFSSTFLRNRNARLSRPKASVLELSRESLLDIPSTTGRKEWCILHYDTVHNPRIAFHFELHWLNCSSMLLDSMIQTWTDRAKRLGFVLIEVPVVPPQLSGPGPFQNATKITLASQPPSVPFLKKRYWDTVLMEEFLIQHEFVLDLEPDERFPPDPNSNLYKRSSPRAAVPHLQYIHVSGEYIVQIIRAQDNTFSLLWTRNRLCQGTRTTMRLESFIKLCSDKSYLDNFWNTRVHDLTVNQDSIATTL